jgi:hypothetical protein
MHDEGSEMMDGLQQYVMSLIGAALICSVVKSLVGGASRFKEVTRVVCGVFMVITAISPLMVVKIPDFDSYIQPIFDTGWKISNDAVNASKAEMVDIIKGETSAYILEKANSRNVDIDVEVGVDEGVLVPTEVIIAGTVSPYDKALISKYIFETLNIPEDQQQWIG